MRLLKTRNRISSADVAVRLAKTLNTSVEYLVTGESAAAQSVRAKENGRRLLHIYSSLPEPQRNLLLSIADDIQRCTGSLSEQNG